jgi:hypothetical protein
MLRQGRISVRLYLNGTYMLFAFSLLSKHHLLPRTTDSILGLVALILFTVSIFSTSLTPVSDPSPTMA